MQNAPVTIRDVVRELEAIDGNGFHHLGQYVADAECLATLRRWTAQKLAVMHEHERQDKLAIYRSWVAGEITTCTWCGMGFEDGPCGLRAVARIDGKFLHSFWCAFRYADVKEGRLELTARGREYAAELQQKKRLYRGGVQGCEECTGTIGDLSSAVIEDGRLIHAGCRARVAVR